MIKTLYAIGMSLFLNTPLYAASGSISTFNLVTFFLAVAALTIGIVNFFRINRVRKIHDVDFMNQKEDVTLTLERFKSSLNQNQRNQNKDFQRQPNAQKNIPEKPAMKPAAATVAKEAEVNKAEKSTVDKAEVPAKPKKKYYHPRRPGSSGEKKQGPKE